jgi:hypothetical protein
VTAQGYTLGDRLHSIAVSQVREFEESPHMLNRIDREVKSNYKNKMEKFCNLVE